MIIKRFVAILCLFFCHCSFGAQSFEPLPPDPNNAALLYYQAFLNLPEPDDLIKALIYDPNLEDLSHFFRTGESLSFQRLEESVKVYETKFRELGIDLNSENSLQETLQKIERFIETVDPNEPAEGYEEYGVLSPTLSKKWQLEMDLIDYQEKRPIFEKMPERNLKAIAEKYLRKSKDTIEFVVAASKIAHCDWGYQYSRGMSLLIPQRIKVRSLLFLMRAEILRLNAEGKSQQAIEYSLVLRRMAMHVGDDFAIPYLLAINFDGLVSRTLRQLLPEVAMDVATLNWLKQELMQYDANSFSPARAFKRDCQLILNDIKAQAKAVALRTPLDPNDHVTTPIWEDLFEDAAQPSQQFILDCCRILEKSQMSYLEKQGLLQDGEDHFDYEHKQVPETEDGLISLEKMLAVSIAKKMPDFVRRICTLSTRYQAEWGLTSAAIDVHLYYCEYGEWPKILPAGSPKNPFNGEDYYYQSSEKGFFLRWDEVGERERSEARRSYRFILKD